MAENQQRIADRNNRLDFIPTLERDVEKERCRPCLREKDLGEVQPVPNARVPTPPSVFPDRAKRHHLRDVVIGRRFGVGCPRRTENRDGRGRAGTLDDGSRSHGIAGLTASANAGMQVVDVGEAETKDERIWRVKWYSGLAQFSELGLAAASGITN